MRYVIESTEAPKAIGPYSQAIKAGGLVFTAGQIAIDPKTGYVRALVGGRNFSESRFDRALPRSVRQTFVRLMGETALGLCDLVVVERRYERIPAPAVALAAR